MSETVEIIRVATKYAGDSAINHDYLTSECELLWHEEGIAIHAKATTAERRGKLVGVFPYQNLLFAIIMKVSAKDFAESTLRFNK